MPPESHHTVSLFNRRQILVSGRLVHATDTFQTACHGRVLPGAQDLPDDTTVTCRGCTGGPRPRRLAYARLTPDQIIWQAVVDAFDTPVRIDHLDTFGSRHPERIVDSHIQWTRSQAAFAALESGLLLGRHARSVMRASGVLEVLAQAPASTLSGMTLSADERQLLQLISQAKEPVAPSDFFHTIHPSTFDQDAPDDDPRREAWAELQLGLYRAMLRLHDLELIRVVVPADGENSDLVEATLEGRSILG